MNEMWRNGLPHLKAGDTVAFTACSNGLSPSEHEETEKLRKKLEQMGLLVKESPYLYRGDTVFSAPAPQRAEALMQLMEDPKVRAVFDISGGDMANELLGELDYKRLRKTKAVLFGYSDLTVLLNAVSRKTGKRCGLYQIRNLVGPCGEKQSRNFRDAFFEGEDEQGFLHPPVHFLRGSRMEGKIAGGNTRCFLKLAGTPYFPTMAGKILLLECNGGEVPQMVTYLSQLKQMGVFDRINGILLGTFTRMEQKKRRPTMEELVLQMTDPDLPVAKTELIGHGPDSSCLMIGGERRF